MPQSDPVSRRAIFLDRDGVINTRYPEYISRWQDFVLYPWTIPALRLLTDLQTRIIMVTNQSAIARGYFSQDALHTLHQRLQEQLGKFSITLHDIRFCPHHPDDNCECRKPKPGMLLSAAEQYQLNLTKSWMVGDYVGDIRAGKNAGTRTILLRGGRAREQKVDNLKPSYLADNLLKAAEIIRKHWDPVT